MKINYGIRELREIHKNIIDIVNNVNNVDSPTVKWIACGAFLAEVYELEVTKHGGLDEEKVEEYKALCREFLKGEKEIM